jgi:phosphoribosylformylglycinamidine (FGAM) synthase-like amidotransferase family enzyme
MLHPRNGHKEVRYAKQQNDSTKKMDIKENWGVDYVAAVRNSKLQQSIIITHCKRLILINLTVESHSVTMLFLSTEYQKILDEYKFVIKY